VGRRAGKLMSAHRREPETSGTGWVYKGFS
jgi:hypothetical protein